MAHHGKKYQDAAKLVDRTRIYPPLEAADLARQTTTVAFDASIEAHLRLGVDPRHADQMVGGKGLVKKIEAGWLEFDVALATPDSMGMVGKLGKILGRRGLMPNPKAGTITFDLERAVKEVKGGRVEFKVDKAGIIHAAFGRSSFEAEALIANLAALIDAINRARPAGAKGQYLR